MYVCVRKHAQVAVCNVFISGVSSLLLKSSSFWPIEKQKIDYDAHWSIVHYAN